MGQVTTGQVSALEAVQEAYFRRDFDRAQALAQGLADPVAEAWAALALWMNGKAAAAEAALKSAFARIEPESTKASIASALMESTSSFGGNLVNAARLVDRLGVTIPFAVRVLADDHERSSGNPVEAFKLLVRAKQADPLDPETDFALARLHARGGRVAKALASLQDTIRNASLGQDYRSLARHHADFKGLLTEPAFVELVDTFPADPPLAALAKKLDDRAFAEVADGAAALVNQTTDPLFALEAWREALNGLINQVPFDEEPSDTLLEALQHVEAQLDARRAAGAQSPAWKRFRPGQLG
jgi:tetratricopeptide (TPR) repeat protein